METAQLKKAGLAILVLGLVAIGLYAAWTKDPIHLYLGIGAAALGGIMTGIGFVKK